MSYHYPPYVLKTNGSFNPSIFAQNHTFSCSDCMLYNNKKKYNEDYTVYADTIDIIFDRQKFHSYHGSSVPWLGGIEIIFKHIGPKNPITNPLHWKFINSVFGNGAKLKLAEFKTPDEIMGWLKTDPLEVIKLMTGLAIPVRKSSEITEHRKKMETAVNIKYRYDYGQDMYPKDLKARVYPALLPWQFIDDSPRIDAEATPAKEAKKDEPAAQPSVAAPAPQASDAGVATATHPTINLADILENRCTLNTATTTATTAPTPW